MRHCRFLSLLLVLLLGGCSEPPPEPSVKQADTNDSAATERALASPEPNKQIVLAADPWCPHNCKAGREREGYMVDIARKIFTDAGYRFEYRNYGWARTLREARNNRIDGVIGALRGDAPDFVFPETPLGSVAITMYTRPDSQWRYQELTSLEGLTLLAINGYSYSPELDNYIRKHTGEGRRVWILTGTSPLERALKLLDEGRADVFAEDRAVMDWFVRQHPSLPAPRAAGVAHRAPIHIAFSPADSHSGELVKLLDRGMARMTSNGELERILSAYGITQRGPASSVPGPSP
jgi:polar amino acid transport system substrate-binding protein